MTCYIVENVLREDVLEISLNGNDEAAIISFGFTRLLRCKKWKSDLFFSPFTPSTQVLLLFPNALHVEDDLAEIKPVVHENIVFFLQRLQNESQLSFYLKEGAGCVSSCCLLLELQCSSIENALLLVDTAGELAKSTDIKWHSPLLIRAMLAEPFDRIQGLSGSRIFSSSVPYIGYESLWSQYYCYPVCPFCADRLDTAVSGYASNESVCRCVANNMHCSCVCLMSCIVCKLFMASLVQQGSTPEASSNAQTARCINCGRSEDPWVCLICGYIGCSRYHSKHAKEHYVATGHCFSMNLLTQDVWDYDSDRFVHHMYFCVDKGTGSASRIHLPETNPNLAELLPVDTSKDTLTKKSLSTKYESELRTSHAQYSIMIKNELDASREKLDQLAMIHVAYEEAERQTEEVVTSLAPELDQLNVKQASLLESLKKATSNALVENAACTQIDTDTQVLRKECHELQLIYDELKEAHRAVVKKNVADMLSVEKEIEETCVLLEEIRSNLSIANQFSALHLRNEEVERFVAVENASKKKKK